VALEPLGPLAEGPALHIRSVVLHQGLLEEHDGSLVVPVVVQPRPGCEGALWVVEGGLVGGWGGNRETLGLKNVNNSTCVCRMPTCFKPR